MSAPSPWFVEHAEALACAAEIGPVVDLACGGGRHTLACAERGWPTLGIDRKPELLCGLRAEAMSRGTSPWLVRADLETGRGIPLTSGRCGAVLVFRFLFRPLAAEIERILAPNGLLVYETFTREQRDLPSGPSSDAFLLEKGELPTLFPGLEIVAHREELRRGEPMAEAVASIVGRRREV